MARLRTNIATNIAGQGWAALMQLAFVPLYLKFLGIESYGLVGFYTVLQSVLQVLDLGLSPTMTREMARYASQDTKGREMRDFVRTIELGYWLVGILIGILIVSGSSLIADHWIRRSSLSGDTVQSAVTLMGIISFFQWPFSLYQGGLMGLQRQVLFNSIKIAMSTLRSVGAVLILWLVSPSIKSFLQWQVFVSALQVSLLAVSFWQCLPEKDHTPRPNLILLRNIRSFVAGMGALSITGIVLTQMDKIVLSKLVSLQQFGYYALASVVAGGLGMISGPLFNAFFPRFSGLVISEDIQSLRDLYHRGTQTMSVLILPLAAVIAVFSPEVVLAWTGNPTTALNTSTALRFLVIGTALNGLMNLPYMLQLAYGWTSIGLRINTIFIVTMIPLLIFAVDRYGPQGAAAVWLLLNAVYFVAGVPLTHRRLLRGEARRWYIEDVGPAFVASLLVAGVARIFFPQSGSRIITATALVTVSIITISAAAISVAVIRKRNRSNPDVNTPVSGNRPWNASGS